MAQCVALVSLACLENRRASPFDAKGGQIRLVDGESKEFGLTAYSMDGAGRYAQMSGCLLRAWISAVVPEWPQPTTKIGECLFGARVRCANSTGIAATERLKSAGAIHDSNLLYPTPHDSGSPAPASGVTTGPNKAESR